MTIRQVENVDATPEKRSYWAIINDYDFNSAICELVDNPLDVWLKREPRRRPKSRDQCRSRHKRSVLMTTPAG